MKELFRTDSFLVISGILFLAILTRYFLSAGLFHYYFFKVQKEKSDGRRLSKRSLRKGQIRREIRHSIVASLVFAIAGAGGLMLWEQGLTQVYTDPALYGYWYLPASFLLALFLHETYYYWTHRWMHRPGIFKSVHKVHHDSLTPTPWTAFSFHFYECIIGALALPLIILILPLHPAVLALHLTVMTITSVINHLGIEIYPQQFRSSAVGKLLIDATHHHYHHEEYKTNYGLYFTFWDKWMGTESTRGEFQEMKLENPDISTDSPSITA